MDDIRDSGSPTHEDSQKAWLTPVLRRLPIAATSGPGQLNQGVGKGKGKSGTNPVS
jgi:hypothetical protein